MAQSVAIIDGFAEGKWHHKILNEALMGAGYTIERDARKADIIIAHSAGCFFLPANFTDKKVLLIGPPFWPSKPLAVSMMQKIWRDFIAQIRKGNAGYWFLKTFWNIVYALSDIVHSMQIGRHARRQRFYEALQDSEVMLVRNQDDAWCTPDIESLLSGKAKIKYTQLPGEHDDCWTNPAPYIQLLKD